jgi:hypothetical protein
MKATVKLLETNLRTKETKDVEIEIWVNETSHYLNITDIENRKQGDIHQTNGIIRYVWNNIPNCLFQNTNNNLTKTALSYKK